MTDLNIIGAGLAGLLAAHAFPKAQVLEASPEPKESHKALLRFRSDAVSKLTGIPFRKVSVRKSIFSEGQHRAPDLRIANLYSQKLFGSGVVGPERSIWNVDPCERYVAPDDFYGQLLDQLRGRVHFGQAADKEVVSKGCISTMPMPSLLKLLEVDAPIDTHFKYSGIRVQRFYLSDADAFQTVYFPDRETDIYRASMTGSTLIVESILEEGVRAPSIDPVLDAFGLTSAGTLDVSAQRYGKILPISDAVRKQLMFGLTYKFGIYSLGRFATWRNILLDDVVKDLKVIQNIRNSESTYDWRRQAS